MDPDYPIGEEAERKKAKSDPAAEDVLDEEVV
jgi:hypothetical protein